MIAAVDERRNDDDETVDLIDIVARLWRGRWIITASVIVATAVFAAVAFLSTPIYRASAVLVPTSSEGAGGLSQALGSLGGLAAMAGINLGSKSATDTAESLAVLRSREFTEGFLVDNHLLPTLYDKKWDKNSNSWKVPAEEQPTLAQAYKYFDKLRTATEDKKTGLVKVTIEWKDREQASLWVNTLIARLNAVMRARAIARTDAYIGFLQKELAATTAVETRHAISRLMESQINERMLANVTEEYAFRVVDRALVPDLKDKIWPKKVLLLACGVLAGGFIGSMAVLVLGALRARRQQ